MKRATLVRIAVLLAIAIACSRVASAADAAPTPARAAASSRAEAPKRTLQDIHIEGEIPVPQVLFVTARDQRRFVEFQHHRYLRTSRALGEDFGFPTRIAVSGMRASGRELPPSP